MEKFALISVSDKTGIVEFAKSLLKFDYEILATGNTAKLLSQNKIPVKEVSDLTGFPEIFEGRVKTLHPKIFGGILFRRDNYEDKIQAKENHIPPIDIVCVNLYPFVQTIHKANVRIDDVIENIDIGGPSLVRAAAKNYKYVSIITNPTQYDSFLQELEAGKISDSTREKLAVAAFSYTSNYDTHIANYLEKRFGLEKSYIRINEKLTKKLRYGENPHQSANIFGDFEEYFEVFHGKEISYNNILDLIAGVELCEELGENACTIIKHNNPAGAAVGISPLDAYLKALKCDPVSAFGGIVTFNHKVDLKTAEKLNEIFLEIVCAPSFSEEAIQILKKKKDRRLVRKLKSITEEGLSIRTIPGGLLVQNKDLITFDKENLKVVTNRKPTEKELEDLTFAWIVAKHTKSNAIVFAKDKTTLGVGAGQMSRLDSSKIAYMKAKEHGLDLTDSVAASDAFFPFADGLLEIIKCGATAVIQPGGSVRDQEVIDAANQNNITMIFTGIRHFKH
ncbi:bifunctional phosphoribosylaminoimidazolecarboxamide formyltransferase/IMP cyclohydrolase [Ignavibacterium sp.]|uniref:bifunctional phosphoribosylaminoimidazolecarboxamide formyltransferase/IMP cyclohydrolase n=1 Tax=Ignavibacterium sp. TaxID=2651167 RepID=UPI00307E740E